MKHTPSSPAPGPGSDDQAKSISFYLSNYIRSLRENVRQTQRWLRQAESHSNVNPDAIEKYKDTIEQQEQKIRDAGPEHPEFKEYMATQISLSEKVKTDHSKRLESTLKEREDQKQQLDKYYQDQREDRYRERQLIRQAKREFERMQNIDDSMPPYMKENLRNFPNNKGYIFKDVWYFGHRPVQTRYGEDPDMYVMFQRKFPGNSMLIHEIKYGSYHRVYEKKTKDSQRILVENRPCPVRS